MRRGSKILAVGALLVGLQLHAPQAESVTKAEIRKAEQRRAALQTELDQAVAQYERARSSLEDTLSRIAVTQNRLTTTEQELDAVQSVLSERASLTYRRGHAGLLSVLLESESPADFARRLILLERAAGSDSEVLLRASRIRAELAEHRADLTARRAEEKELVESLRGMTNELSNRFSEAVVLEKRLLSERDAEIRRRREAAARAARAAAVARRSSFNPGSFACPVDGPNSFTDTWGDPRSGGRRHQGVDIYAASGTPSAAVVDGTILRLTRSSRGGISLYLRGGDGSEYFYAHLSGYAVSAGQRVSAGQHVAYVGNTGNARGGVPHLHFEIHPGGGAAINPYPTVRAACG